MSGSNESCRFYRSGGSWEKERGGRSGGFNLGGRGNEEEENTSISVLKTLNERGRGERESSIMVGSEIYETFNNKVFVFSRKLPELKFRSLE